MPIFFNLINSMAVFSCNFIFNLGNLLMISAQVVDEIYRQ